MNKFHSQQDSCPSKNCKRIYSLKWQWQKLKLLEIHLRLSTCEATLGSCRFRESEDILNNIIINGWPYQFYLLSFLFFFFSPLSLSLPSTSLMNIEVFPFLSAVYVISSPVKEELFKKFCILVNEIQMQLTIFYYIWINTWPEKRFKLKMITLQEKMIKQP